jgi:hypothetical protein
MKILQKVNFFFELRTNRASFIFSNQQITNMVAALENNIIEIVTVEAITKKPKFFNCILVRENGCFQKMHRMRASWFRQPHMWNLILFESDKQRIIEALL